MFYFHIADCGLLADPPGGSVNISAGTTYLNEAIFSCDVGYTMTGSNTSICQDNGQWSNVDPLCRKNGMMKVFTYSSSRY